MEYDDQCAIIQWRDYNLKKHPELFLLEGSMNGIKLPIGLAVKAKKQGMLKGMPDLRLPVSRHGFNALYIELKYGKNKPSPTQLYVMRRLEDEGAMCQVCYGSKAAIDAITSYLGDRE